MNRKVQPRCPFFRCGAPSGYNHHGLYVSDNRVIQFGSGITLTNKGRTGVSTLCRFMTSKTVARLRLYITTLKFATGYDPPADEPWKIIGRAEFLLKLQPKVSYHLIGHNCEHIANMCVAGTWHEKGSSAELLRRQRARFVRFPPLAGPPQSCELADTPMGEVGSDGVDGHCGGFYLRLQPPGQEVLDDIGAAWRNTSGC